MKHTYDWSKLDAGWEYCANQLPGPLLCLGSTSYWTLDFLERDEISLGSKHQHAKAQLAKCRIPAPDMATVTELRPRNEYDWSKLEGSGWRHDPEVHGQHMISNGEFEWWYDSSEPGKLMLHNALAQFDAHNALVAQQEAERLVAKCRRDWRDEVKQACEGLTLSIEWYANPPWSRNHAAVSWDEPGQCSAVTMESVRTFQFSANTTDCAHLLAISLIIERLKKLGWREA
jgi:hypothetical protein